MIEDTGASHFDISAKDMKLFLFEKSRCTHHLFFFLRLGMFFVWLAVPSKPSN